MKNQNYKNSYIAKDKELVSLSVYNVGFQKCYSNHQWGPGIRDHYLIHYIISGKGSYQLNNKTYQLSAGDSFLAYPNTEITYCADTQNPWEYAWVGFTGSDASIILSATDFSMDHPYIQKTPMGNIIQEYIRSIYEARGNEFEHAVKMTGHLYALLSVFIHNANSVTIQNTANTYVQKSIEYISANYSYPITIEDIASYVGISRSQLFRSFDAVVQKSPKEYLTDYRIKQACFLLEHTNFSITAIANSLGFDNSLYFSKTFHKKKGMSPSQFRHSHKVIK